MRTAFQTAAFIWKSCDLASPRFPDAIRNGWVEENDTDLASPRLPDPNGNGWVEENGLLVPILYTLPAVPVRVRDLRHLFCKETVQIWSEMPMCHGKSALY